MTKSPRAAKMTPERIDLAMRLRIAFALIARAQRRDVPDQLTPVQISALCKIELHGPIRLGDLAAHEQVAGPTMVRMVTSLEKSGFVTRETDPTSARSSQVTLTASGRKQISVVRRDRTHVMARRLAALSEEQREAITAALPAIEALVESVEPDTGPALRELERSRRAKRARRTS